MGVKLATAWQDVRASYWFLPVVMAVVAAGLSFLVIEVEVRIGHAAVTSLDWVYSGGVDGARGVLTTIAGSAITVAGTTFSITIASLSLASNQFGPRVLRGFMRDRGNQIVLGTFTSTFLYCLLVLRTVRGGEDGVFVPHLGVSVAVALAILCVGVLIYFIHHAAFSVQVSHVVQVAGTELDHALRRLFPEKIGTPHGEGNVPDTQAETVSAESEGYVAAIDADALLRMAENDDLVIRIEARPGDYVFDGVALAKVWPNGDGRVKEAVRRCFVLSPERTTQQDAAFAFHQLAEVGVRALSPGINDPYTAITVIDRLTASLKLLDGRNQPEPYRFDAEGTLRVVANPHGMAEYVRAAFRLLGHAAKSQTVVIQHLEARLRQLAEETRKPEMKTALIEEARTLGVPFSKPREV
ncbi:MAG: DUF2254 domain-containing protein [Fimbriimonas sp.]